MDGWNEKRGGVATISRWEEGSRRQVSGAEGTAFRGRGSQAATCISLLEPHSSRELLENEELHGADQITLHDK